MRRRKTKLTRKQKRIRARVTFRTIFLLSITLIFNTYAWFLYATTVTTNLTAHVSAWHVEFEVNNESIEREVDFIVTQAYPGMTARTQNLVISNTGERPADVVYEVKQIRIFDDIYISTEEVAAGATVPQGANTSYSASQLLSKLQNDYPFQVTIATTTQSLAVNQSTTLSITFSWAYSSGNDIVDTAYGVDAYDFYDDNPGVAPIQIVIKVTAIQHNS